MMTMSAIYYMLISWYPKYLQAARGVSPGQSSWLASMVLGAGAFGCFFGGWLTDWMVLKTGSRRWGRTAQSVAGAGVAATGILASLFTDNTVLASVFVAVACMGVQIQVPAWWASATQVSGIHLGALFGLMNMIGALGAICSQLFLGSFADMMKGWGYTGRRPVGPRLLRLRGHRARRHDHLVADQPDEVGRGEDRPRGGARPGRAGVIRRMTSRRPTRAGP